MFGGKGSFGKKFSPRSLGRFVHFLMDFCGGRQVFEESEEGCS